MLQGASLHRPMPSLHRGSNTRNAGAAQRSHDPCDLVEAERINCQVVTRALAMNGTCTGEHGIGFGKLDFLDTEHGEAVAVMRAIKQAPDPRNVFNRGKVIRDQAL
jgi:D-lactate dehydrogenase (cytochrome)